MKYAWNTNQIDTEMHHKKVSKQIVTISMITRSMDTRINKQQKKARNVSKLLEIET